MLIILIASAIGVFCIAGWLPGHIAKTRNHPYAQAVTVAGWVTLIFGFALWPVALIWAYVDVPAAQGRRRVMGVAIINIYLVLLFLLVHFRHRPLQPVLEGVAFHRAAADAVRPVDPDGLGRAAGLCAGGPQRGLDRARCCGRSDRCPGRGQYPAEGGRCAVQDRSDAL